jgi:hypothetical protein
MQTLELELVDEDYSSYTLAPIIAKFMDEFLGLEPLFEEHISLKKRYSQFSIGKLAFLSIFLVILGIERFSHLDDKWARERGLAKINNVRRLPGKSTLFQFLSSFTGNQINQLSRIHRILVREHRDLWMPKKGPYPIDIDLNTKSVEGKKIEKAIQGYNKKRPGRHCLQWSRGLFCGIPFWSKLHSGNTNSVRSLKEKLRWIQGEIASYMPHALSGVFLRLDGGYWSPQVLKDIDLPWMIHCPMLKQFKTDEYIGKPDAEWKEYSQTTCYIDLGRKNVADLSVRILLLKQLERPMKKSHGNMKPKYIYYTIATSISHWSASSIIRAYRGRQVIEDHFKETNQAFFSNKLPSGGLRANEAFLWFVTFAYTISTFFKTSSLANLISPAELQNLPT